VTKMIPKYEEDFYGWVVANSTLLKQGKFNEVDMENIIEEIDSMGRSEENQLTRRFSLILMHILKWQYQPTLQCKSWKITLREQRRASRRLINRNPSLKAKLNDCLIDAYEDAVDEAIKETGLDEKTFPSSCPYTFDQIMSDEFYPE
jgi:hypothetical protein